MQGQFGYEPIYLLIGGLMPLLELEYLEMERYTNIVAHIHSVYTYPGAGTRSPAGPPIQQ